MVAGTVLRQKDQRINSFFKGTTFRFAEFEVHLEIQVVKPGRHLDIEERCSK